MRISDWSSDVCSADLGIILSACEAAHISPRSAYALRIRRDGAAFRLGWDAAILIARARLADDLLARALTGHEEVIRKDMDAGEITRHRHDNRSEEHTSELQSLMRNSYAVFCLKKKK